MLSRFKVLIVRLIKIRACRKSLHLILLSSVLCALSLTYYGLPCRADFCQDNAIQVEADTQDPDLVRFLLSSQRTIETTVTFSCDSLKNCRSSQALPFTFVVDRDYNQVPFLSIERDNYHRAWSYGKWKYHFKFGTASTQVPIDYIYSLPYLPSEHYLLVQGYFGSFSHQRGTQDQYAVDFGMPEGTTVCAARAGTVIAYRDDSSRHGPNEDFENCVNYIVIKHGDGSYGLYLHLKCKGVLVSLGQHVEENAPIGISGWTGKATQPHLHFAVYHPIDGLNAETLPFRVRTPEGILNQLEEGCEY